MRFDRLITLYFFQPLRRLLSNRKGLRVSILMYHSVSDRDESNRHPYYETNIRPEVFARQMQFLADNNYKVISLSGAVALISGNSPSSLVTQSTSQPVNKCKYCVLTFDDGYRDFHDTAWPIVKEHGFTSTMFLPTGHITDERRKLNGRECLTWTEVRALAADGADFGAHTVSHVQLYEIARQDIVIELRASKQAIEEALGKTVDHYSYAYAFPEHDKNFVKIYEMSLQKAGYQSAVTTRLGTAKPGDNSYTLKRIPVSTHDDERLFFAKLEGAYDWLAVPQTLSKNFKGRGRCE